MNMQIFKKVHFYVLLIVFIATSLNGCKKDGVIQKKDPVITWANPANISYETLLSATQLNATSSVPGTFVFTPAIGTKLNEGDNQDLKVDFTPTDAANYNTATKTVKINVKAKKTPVITWANPTDIIYGTLLSATQLNATADVPGTFVYTPAVGTKLNEGTNQDLKVDFTPTDIANYNVATITVKINVKAKINPVITWSNPSNITYGTLLSATQLNATADVPGTLVYTPAIGTKLNGGSSQDLKVDFTPTDAVTYNVVSKTVKINVLYNLNNTTWDVLIIYDVNNSWHADVVFNSDGTTKYDEPDSPGVYLSYGVWTMTGNNIHFGIGLDPNYVFDGTIVGNTMSGTFKFGTATKTWSAIKK